MIFAIITAVLAYRRAKEHGRSGFLWAIAGGAVFIGAQLIVTVGAGLVMGLGIAFLDWPETVFDEALYVGPVTVVGIAASILASWLLLRYLDKPIHQDPVELSAPPPPPLFGGNQ